ncbi:TetR/AcrR family transcriptional regulator [Engelhardtia mirabilis]|uniref:Bacterial regulatory protein, tetR family n=1 Tax=Engelhardtia mirabilis TaxID=2528011 RepID=A0A518BIS2_9BACT|nr:Bacterial regulatory protein, tetR family [Planctomycetes bacterium Pla133]QDV01203.1 Bacterial regulatory protein, tetR family [Planctomycetes bacterium Pla86]
MDAPPTRKQREIAEREELLLDAARSILLERGYLGLTMDRIAEATEYSKGTVYLHFDNKEEVVAALGLRVVEAKRRFFERAAAFDGGTRERCCAIGIGSSLWAALYPEDIRLTQIVKAQSLGEKVRPERREALEVCEEACAGAVVGTVLEAAAAGDLQLPPGVVPGMVAHGLWSLHWGAQSLSQLDIPLEHLGIADSPELLMRHCHALLDGYGWRPLFTEHDWNATYARVRAEVFADEFEQLAARDDDAASPVQKD